MSQYTYWLRPVAGSELAKNLCKVAARLEGPHTVELTLKTNIGNYTSTRTTPIELEKKANELIDTLTKYSQCEVESARLHYAQTNGELTYQCEGFLGKFIITNHADPLNPQRVYEALSKHFTLQRKSEIAPARLPMDQQEAFQFVQATQLKFSAEAAKLSQLGTEQIAKFIETTREETVKLETEYQARKKKLEAETATERKKLDQDRQEHEETVKGYELRENTAIRRKLLDDILARHESQKEFAFSIHTERTRRGVVLAMVLLIFGSMALGSVFGRTIFVGGTAIDWHVYLGLAVCFGVFVTSLIYLAKWNDRYFRDHADAEIANKKFANDIMRASWIAELYIELRKNQGPELPPEMLKSFTNQLFVPSFNPEDPKHPYEQVADTLKGITKIKANKDGIELQSAKG